MLDIWRALRLVWSIAPGWTAANVALAVVQGLLPLLSVVLLGRIIDAITTGISATDKSAAFRDVLVLILLAALVGVATAGMRSLSALVSEAQGLVVTDQISDLIHAKSMAVDLQYYESARYHDVLYRTQLEAPFRPMRMVSNLVQVGQGLVTLAAMVGLLLSLHWVIGVIIIAVALPGALVRLRYSRQLYSWQRERTGADRLANYYHWLLIEATRAKEIRLFGLGELFRGRFRDLRRELRGERLRITFRRTTGDFASGALATIGVFGTFAFIAWQAVKGVITIGQVTQYYYAFQQALSALQQVLTAMAGLYEDNLFLTYFYEFLAIEPEVRSPEHPRAVPRPMRRGIAFDDVTFTYPGTERTALEHVSLAVRPGEVAALVGPNGSGKTTLVKLLCRLYDPQGGAVLLDGIDLRELDPAALRGSMSVIFQDFAQYQLSARENVWVGNVALDPHHAAITEAARHSGADEVIARLPRGYETMLGRMFEDGAELSIGEWQKVALARAFVRDSDILVLDEPTSALDPESEWKIFERIRELADGRAIILISHRFSTVRTADRIHILDRGRVIESGAHGELMTLNGVYAHMYEVQARGFHLEDQARLPEPEIEAIEE